MEKKSKKETDVIKEHILDKKEFEFPVGEDIEKDKLYLENVLNKIVKKQSESVARFVEYEFNDFMKVAGLNYKVNISDFGFKLNYKFKIEN